MATWTKEGSHTFVWAETPAHSCALRKGRAFRKENRWEDRIASDWKEGERMIRRMTNIAAEKNPENLVIPNMFFFFLLVFLVFAPSSARVQVVLRVWMSVGMACEGSESGEKNNPCEAVVTCARWRFLIFLWLCC